MCNGAVRHARVPSGPLRTLACRWKTRPGRSAPARSVRVGALVDALGVSATTASVLVRRGYGDPADARAFLDGALPGHDPFLLGDMREAVERDPRRGRGGRADLRARRLRRRRHLRDGARGAAAARARRRRRPGICRRASRRATACAAQTLARLADEGVDLVLTVDCGITAVAEVEQARRLGLEVVVTDHHRPGDAFPACPVVAPLEGRLSVHRPLRHRRRLEARRGAARPRPSVPRPAPRRRRARDGRRRRAARRREPRARAARPAPARADAEARPARADARRRRRPGRVRRERDRLPARAAHQRVRPARPARGGARAAAHRGRRRGRAARRGARGAEPRAPGGRGADPPRGDRRDRVVAGGAPRASAATSSPARTGTRA